MVKPSASDLTAETLRETTVGDAERSQNISDVVAPVLTILWHPDPSRVGERSRLADLGGEGRVRLSRLLPLFGPATGSDTTPLALPTLSRRPIHLESLSSGGMRIVPDPEATALKVDGHPLTAPRDVSADELRFGVVMELARRVVLLLHTIPPVEEEQPELGIVGQSPAIRLVRTQIIRVAAHMVPVLIRGASGTGKELVAAAIHQLSPRSEGPFVAVNMAAVVPTTAASALFGHVRGAFTGADTASGGLFGEAHGGTLFMDEIGETPAPIQPALLRALEGGEVLPVGGASPSHVDVRIVAATDAALEEAVDAGIFKLPLFQRLAGYQIMMPPLSTRRADIARLLVTFLRDHLGRVGCEHLLQAPDGSAKPWLPAEVVARATLAPWPGNVRELKNFAHRLVIDFSDAPHVKVGALGGLLPELAAAHSASASVEVLDSAPRRSGEEAPTDDKAIDIKPRRLIRDIAEVDLVAALARHDYRPGPAARDLGVSRTSLYALIEASSKVRMAGELTAEEIHAKLHAAGGDLRSAARLLLVSERGLRLRMKQLGLS